MDLSETIEILEYEKGSGTKLKQTELTIHQGEIRTEPSQIEWLVTPVGPENA